MKNQVNERKVNDLVLSAILIAMATLLGMIKFLHLPFGGSITLFSNELSISLLPRFFVNYNSSL